MTTHKYAGGCHCGNIAVEMKLTGRPDSYNPRACDCDFCRKHAASYISDPHGRLEVIVKDEANVSIYRQGSEIADCLVCGVCGVLVGISYEEDGRVYATVNSKAIGRGADFGAEIAVSPKTLSDQDKVQRWKNVWFSDVRINKGGA